jgi:hypothetical protein
MESRAKKESAMNKELFSSGAGARSCTVRKRVGPEQHDDFALVDFSEDDRAAQFEEIFLVKLGQ